MSADARADRLHILDHNGTNIASTRRKLLDLGWRDFVVIVADARDEIGRVIALAAGYTAEQLAERTASYEALKMLPTLTLGMPRDVLVVTMAKTHPSTSEALADAPVSAGLQYVLVVASGGVTLVGKPVDELDALAEAS